MTKKLLILVVDDEQPLLQQITLTLEEAGYEVITAKEGQEALDKIEQMEEIEDRKPDLVLLDSLMPAGLGGERTATLIRNKYPPGELAIIMMTKPDKKKEAQMLMLRLVDDFIYKETWTMEVLLARIEIRLPRHKRAKKLICDDLEIDLGFRKAKLSGQVIELSQSQVKILVYLMQNSQRDIHYTKILREVWPGGFDTTENQVRIAIHYIRKALKDSSKFHKLPDYSKFLETGNGEGTYRWVKDVMFVE